MIPLIVYANHSSWWDGLVLFEIIRRIDFELYVMMEEKHLRRLSLFSRLGAFSVVRENPRQAVESIKYAVDLLRTDANRCVIIFPQGEIQPNDVRPIEFYRGLARIIEKTGKCAAVPVALRFEFAGNFKPEIYVKIGAPDFFPFDTDFNAKDLTKNLEMRLTETLDGLRRDVVCGSLAEYEKSF